MVDRRVQGEGRSDYLLDGRRVTIGDLIGSGDLPPGTELRFERPRSGQVFSAIVTQAGTISLDGGQEFRSPSRAAAVAADVSAMDGWHAWTVASSRQTLDALRQKLLDRVAADSDSMETGPGDEASDQRRRYELLKEARAHADAGDPLGMSVRELLALWNVKGRGTRINQRIDADLANHGLTTSPSFRKVTIDAALHLVTASQEAESSGHAPADVDDADDLDVGPAQPDSFIDCAARAMAAGTPSPRSFSTRTAACRSTLSLQKQQAAKRDLRRTGVIIVRLRASLAVLAWLLRRPPWRGAVGGPEAGERRSAVWWSAAGARLAVTMGAWCPRGRSMSPGRVGVPWWLLIWEICADP